MRRGRPRGRAANPFVQGEVDGRSNSAGPGPCRVASPVARPPAVRARRSGWHRGGVAPPSLAGAPAARANSVSSSGTLAAGGSHSHALGADGTVLAWGHNGQGRLGNGTT